MPKKYLFISIAIIGVLISMLPAGFATERLAEGITCRAKKLYNAGGRLVTAEAVNFHLRRAQANVTTVLRTEKRKAKPSQQRIRTLTARLNLIRGAIPLVPRCARGQLEAVRAFFRRVNGSFAGSYQGVAFNQLLSGEMIVVISRSGQKIRIELGFTGDLLNFVPTGQVVFDFDIREVNGLPKIFPLNNIKATGTALGDLDVSITSDKVISIRGRNLSNNLLPTGAEVTFDGQFSDDGRTFIGNFAALVLGSAPVINGNFALFKG
ncbi:MAG TPA: hypothetical protein PKD37_00415 [Oligoflexia bacterium]|nr:hypothetical protein [Oligoflexia bacterium]HMP26443.1 hypothetical protein [Oligoflexia bacterium]